MKCYVKLIGVVDKNNLTHYVEFFEGLNIITGKSSTGKSAIIEIFDYCFGSTEFTVPEGVITQRAEIYFTILQFQNISLLLARRGASGSCLIKEISEIEVEKFKSAVLDDFQESYFIPLSEFKKELGRYFNVTLTDVDEDISNRDYTGRKSSTPSIRSFASFMLQHQNLIANKHAIFFRFEEKVKREQAIDHFKIFLGIADQSYFILSQELNEKRQALKKIDLALPKKAEEKAKAKDQISKALNEYSSISGTELLNVSIDSIVASPRRALDMLIETPIRIDALSKEYEKRRDSLDGDRSLALARVRSLERKLSAVSSSISYADNFKESLLNLEIPESAEIGETVCPFCDSQTSHATHEANKLVDAIHWLNNELRLSPYMRESFLEDEKKLKRDVNLARQELQDIQNTIEILDQQTEALNSKRTVSELAIKAKLRVEAVLEMLLTHSQIDLKSQQDELKKDIAKLEAKIKSYNMAARIDEISKKIDLAMKSIGEGFEFEKTYRPINLKFSLDTFDLWHETDSKKQVFLRSMGSGANWLYCHLTLFLALHRVFAESSQFGCKIPPILFLDQPTQVYFPNYLNDDAVQFEAEKLVLATREKAKRDEDIEAVVNMYNKLILFCKRPENDIVLQPQIIVTDHADHLELAEGESFDSYVRARWRTRGFIKEVDDLAAEDQPEWA